MHLSKDPLVRARRTSLHLLSVGVIATLMSLMVACAAPRVQTPSGYVELEDHFGVNDATYKAVSSDGGVILVRLQEDQPAGALSFWTDAFTRELVDGRGYELLEHKDVKRPDGTVGRVILLRGSHNEQPYRYSVAIYLEEEDIVTVESSVPEDKYEEHAKRVLGAIESVYWD